MHADLGALVEMLIEFVAFRTESEILPDVLLDLRHAGVVFVEFGRDELASRTLGRTVDPGEVWHGAPIQPDPRADGDKPVIR